MAPPRFGSLRRSRPETHRLTPFRDDTGLVALRYEQTKQAEPPIPIPPPRNPRRLTRGLSAETTTTTTTTAATRTTTVTTSLPLLTSYTSTTAPSSPVTVGPPRGLLLLTSLPPVPPPQEEHPLFRNQRREPSEAEHDPRRRDSGAPTVSTTTLREEGAEDLTRHKMLDDSCDTPWVYSHDETQPQQQQPMASHLPRPRVDNPPAATAATVPTTPQPQPQRPRVSTTQRVEEAQAQQPPQAVTPTRSLSKARKISLSLSAKPSVKEASPKKLQKKNKQQQQQQPILGNAPRTTGPVAVEAGAPPTLPPAPERGSGQGPDESPASPKLQPPLRLVAPPPADLEAGGSHSAAAAVDRGQPHADQPPFPSSPGPPPTGTAASNASNASGSSSPSFSPITTRIPDDSLWDDVGNVSFSHRGSLMLLGGKRKKQPVPDRDNHNNSSSSSNDGADPPSHQDSDRRKNPPPISFPPSSSSSSYSSSSAAAMAMQPPDGPGIQEAHPTPAINSHHDGPADAPAPVLADAPAPSVPSIRVSSMDVERESQKVRSLYESGDDLNWEDGARLSFVERLEPTAEVPSDEEENCVSSRRLDLPSPSDATAINGDALHPHPSTITPRSALSLSPLRDSRLRRDYEPAGGIEDWADLDGVEVDRYGFITPKRPVSRAGSAAAGPSPLVTARKRNVLTKRPSTSHSSSLPGGFIRPPSRKVSARSLNTYTSELSSVSRRSTHSSIRSATNRLTHNRDRRWLDGASEMLSLQAGLAGFNDDEKMSKLLEAQKRKEAERSEKWRKMAIPVNKAVAPASAAAAAAATAAGGRHAHTSSLSSFSTTNTQPAPGAVVSPLEGLSYTFDTTSPKLIDRTWKGIPDCWRSAAWYSFLSASARAHGSHETEDFLIAEFRRLQGVASPDDVQIDLDVPRTVSGHIMFRRRYRGGQRLLFRVLHAISLYFPATGYVQGMASLAATLLCYFDEERAFVMMVRLWRYRGLETLYQPGFAGLMGALADFEKHWLGGAARDVAAKLNELAIDATVYGTRWYLTLFNLSIPFPAQLRVWDVFMLLGDCPPDSSSFSPPSQPSSSTNPAEPSNPDSREAESRTPSSASQPPKGLDILHATAAALIHALRDVLLDADFESAMKTLTAWIPVRDEDLLMNVAKAEWRRHQERKRGGRLWERGREQQPREKEKEKGRGIGRLWERDKDREKDKGKEKDRENNRDKEKKDAATGA
ncbi:hypothetical protein VTJ83DRAFT_6537 [Remersonia thermophila]|uniref:Rab-GAP TBC domain-containing protein n=1 Tax=Remersonia thermophila TaxID=72144 RepID=A0ABR4D538_9PEZI